jgi:hypothetical protein
MSTDAQDEILAAACMALDKAHDLLSFVVKYRGKLSPEFVSACEAWVDGEYDPAERRPKPCKHNWAKTKLDNMVYCTRCNIENDVET